MLVNILLGLAAVVIVLLIVAALKPAAFRVARTAVIGARPEDVFAHVNDFRKWPAWSPFEKFDPAMKKTYDGAPSGVGTAYSWAGNRNAGEGRATITESRPSELIRIRLDFVKPFAGTSIAEFDFKPDGDRTAVTWSLAGDNNFVCRVFGLFVSTDKMCGKMFDAGLADLKKTVESMPKP
jgi:Polyketide cyclase / dehydrase and lipid transport